MTPLRQYRKDASLTLEDLANRVRQGGGSISPSQLSRIERTGAKRLETAMVLSTVTGLPVEALAETASQ